ncbi:MAG: hypothetical protein ACOYK9_06150 [Chlamydiia bacterium]
MSIAMNPNEYRIVNVEVVHGWNLPVYYQITGEGQVRFLMETVNQVFTDTFIGDSPARDIGFANRVQALAQEHGIIDEIEAEELRGQLAIINQWRAQELFTGRHIGG